MKRWSGAKSYGFTAIELIIVIAIAAIILAIAIPLYNNSLDRQNLRTALSQVESDLRNTQAKSKATSIPYEIMFSITAPNNTFYSIYSHPTTGLQTLVAKVPLPGNVVVSNITYGGGEPNTITYYQPVSAKETDGGTITLRTPRGTTGQVIVAAITGRITVSP
jgi:prepilin-type N-terminal cleavage/methylation domain-containing protein